VVVNESIYLNRFESMLMDWYDGDIVRIGVVVVGIVIVTVG